MTNFIFVFAAESQSSAIYEASFFLSDANEGYSTKEIDGGYVFENQQYILKNFISPFKFGLGYKAKIFGSIDPAFASAPYEEPDSSNAFVPESVGDDTSGMIFDYREGGLFITVTSTGLDPSVITPHPLWIEAYRYYGPLGTSGPNHTITASNIQVEDNLNIDGTLSFQGFNFIESTNASFSGSTVFGSGSSPSESTHQFTGSVFITGGLFVDGASVGTGTGTGGSGVMVFSSSLHDDVKWIL